jgi:CspA family cold shock protein
LRLSAKASHQADAIPDLSRLRAYDAREISLRCAGDRKGQGCRMAMTGTVKFFNAERGYGFIKPDDGGRDVFVHITAVEQAGLKTLAEGQLVSFEVEPDKKGKGPKAVDLVLKA